jgi:hypothetical protein
MENDMRRILLTAAFGALVFSTAGAMAQSAPPVPNASGSQTTNPNSYGSTANPGMPSTMPGQAMNSGAPCAPVPNASGSQATAPCSYGSTAQPGMNPAATGSVNMAPMTPPPVPNASGSQTTNPGSYGDTKPQ